MFYNLSMKVLNICVLIELSTAGYHKKYTDWSVGVVCMDVYFYVFR